MKKKLKIIIGKDSRNTKIYIGKHQIKLIQKITFEAIAGGIIKTKLTFPNLFGNKIENVFEDKGFAPELLESFILLKDIDNLDIEILPYDPISTKPLIYKEIVNYINLKAFL